MGARKRISSNKNKNLKNKFDIWVSLKNHSSSPRKIRLIANIIKGNSIDKALSNLKYIKNHASVAVSKLLLSGISNWQLKNKNYDIEDYNLYVKNIMVNNGKTLKRFRAAPQGRGHKIKKRFNHLIINISNKNNVVKN